MTDAPIADSAADLRADLRERLAAMRDELIASLAAAPHLDGGLLSLLATVASAIRALDDARP